MALQLGARTPPGLAYPMTVASSTSSWIRQGGRVGLSNAPTPCRDESNACVPASCRDPGIAACHAADGRGTLALGQDVPAARRGDSVAKFQRRCGYTLRKYRQQRSGRISQDRNEIQGTMNTSGGGGDAGAEAQPVQDGFAEYYDIAGEVNEMSEVVRDRLESLELRIEGCERGMKELVQTICKAPFLSFFESSAGRTSLLAAAEASDCRDRPTHADDGEDLLPGLGGPGGHDGDVLADGNDASRHLPTGADDGYVLLPGIGVPCGCGGDACADGSDACRILPIGADDGEVLPPGIGDQCGRDGDFRADGNPDCWDQPTCAADGEVLLPGLGDPCGRCGDVRADGEYICRDLPTGAEDGEALLPGLGGRGGRGGDVGADGNDACQDLPVGTDDKEVLIPSIGDPCGHDGDVRVDGTDGRRGMPAGTDGREVLHPGLADPCGREGVVCADDNDACRVLPTGADDRGDILRGMMRKVHEGSIRSQAMEKMNMNKKRIRRLMRAATERTFRDKNSGQDRAEGGHFSLMQKDRRALSREHRSGGSANFAREASRNRCTEALAGVATSGRTRCAGKKVWSC